MAAAASMSAAVSLSDVPATPVSETLRRGSRLISPKVGLIRGLAHGEYRTQDPVTFALGSRVADLSRVSDVISVNKAGGGGETIEMALAATIGEAVERYCTLVYNPDDMVLASWRDEPDTAVHPDLLRLFTAEQVAARPPTSRLVHFTEATRLRWVWCHSLTHGVPRLVPAPLVYLSYEPGADEGFIGRNASSGLAAGATLEEAILSGLHEVVERDAFTLSWMRRYAGREIILDDPQYEAIRRERFHGARKGVEFRLFEITTEAPICSVFAILRRPSEMGPILAVASVTRLSPRAVVEKCFREIGQGLPYFRYLAQRLQDWTPRDDFSDVATFDHHCMLYFKRPELVDPALSFLAQAEQKVPLSEIPDHSTGRVLGDIHRCVELLAERGFEVLVADITTPEIRDIGFRVVRVVVPGLTPLHGTHTGPYLASPRLYGGPYEAEWLSKGWQRTDGLNPFPHPFP